jgi:hypothetical protein
MKGPNKRIDARHPTIYTIEEAKQRPFMNHVWDRVWHVDNRRQFANTRNCHRPHCPWGPGPPISHVDQPYMPRLVEKADECTHNSMT